MNDVEDLLNVTSEQAINIINGLCYSGFYVDDKVSDEELIDDELDRLLNKSNFN